MLQGLSKSLLIKHHLMRTRRTIVMNKTMLLSWTTNYIKLLNQSNTSIITLYIRSIKHLHKPATEHKSYTFCKYLALLQTSFKVAVGSTSSFPSIFNPTSSLTIGSLSLRSRVIMIFRTTHARGFRGTDRGAIKLNSGGGTAEQTSQHRLVLLKSPSLPREDISDFRRQFSFDLQ